MPGVSDEKVSGTEQQVSLSLHPSQSQFPSFIALPMAEEKSLAQLSQLGGEAAFFQNIFPYSFSISHKKLSNPAW